MQWTAVEIEHTSPEVPTERLNASLAQGMTTREDGLGGLADATKTGRMALGHGRRSSTPVKHGHNLLVPSGNLPLASGSSLLQAFVFPLDMFLDQFHPIVQESINIKSGFVGSATQGLAGS